MVRFQSLNLLNNLLYTIRQLLVSKFLFYTCVFACMNGLAKRSFIVTMGSFSCSVVSGFLLFILSSAITMLFPVIASFRIRIFISLDFNLLYHRVSF